MLSWVTQRTALSQAQRSAYAYLVSLTALQTAVVARRLPILNVQWGAQPVDSIGMPVAAYLLGECLLRWGSAWKLKEVRRLAAAATCDSCCSSAC